MTGLTSRRPFTFLGIVLALLVIAAFVLVAINASTGSTGPSQNVVVATKDLAPRIPIDAGSLELKTIQTSGYPSNLLFTKIADVAGTVPLVTIAGGEAITANLVAKPGQSLGAQSEYLPIPSGYVALTIPTSEQQGVAGYIQPGDYISVIATVSSGAKVSSKTVFINLHVIRVGVPTAANASAAATATSLTVVVTACQAEYITWFLTYASLKYELSSYQDYGSPVTAKDPNCQSVSDAKGVTLKLVQQAYPSLF
jgi:Flp pilus assembly protein CpaB